MINDLRHIWGRWEFPKGFFGYARVLGSRMAALGRFYSKIYDFRSILGPWDFPKGFFGYILVSGHRRAALGRF